MDKMAEKPNGEAYSHFSQLDEEKLQKLEEKQSGKVNVTLSSESRSFQALYMPNSHAVQLTAQIILTLLNDYYSFLSIKLWIYLLNRT